MLATAQDVFAETVRMLPPVERLRLAALILDNLTQTPTQIVDVSSIWSEQDEIDVVTYSLQNAGIAYPEEEGIV